MFLILSEMHDRLFHTFQFPQSLAYLSREKGKFRHLPVVESGEVTALLDINKCLYDAIVKMEKAAEQGSAISAAVRGLERQRSNNLSAPNIEGTLVQAFPVNNNR